MNVTHLDAARILAHYEHLGLTPPDGLVQAAKISAEISVLARNKPAELGAELRDQIAAGTLKPGTLADVISDAAAVASKAAFLTPLLEQLHRGVRSAVKTAVADESIVAELNGLVGELEGTVLATQSVIGTSPDPAAIAIMGPDAVTELHIRKEADEALQNVHMLRSAHGAAVGFGHLHCSWYLAEGGSEDFLWNANKSMFSGPGSPIIRLIDAGYLVRVNTQAEAAAMVAAGERATATKSKRPMTGKEAAAQKGWDKYAAATVTQ